MLPIGSSSWVAHWYLTRDEVPSLPVLEVSWGTAKLLCGISNSNFARCIHWVNYRPRRLLKKLRITSIVGAVTGVSSCSEYMLCTSYARPNVTSHTKGTLCLVLKFLRFLQHLNHPYVLLWGLCGQNSPHFVAFRTVKARTSPEIWARKGTRIRLWRIWHNRARIALKLWRLLSS